MENGDNRKQTSSTSEENRIANEPKTVQSSAIIQEADDFLRKWTNGEILVNYERAKNLESTMQEGKDFWGRPKKRKKQFCDDLGELIAIYQLDRDTGTPKECYVSAFRLIGTVQKALAYGALRNAKQQQRDYEQEIQRLKEQVDTLTKLNLKLATENKRLHNLLPNESKERKGDTEVGDVGR